MFATPTRESGPPPPLKDSPGPGPGGSGYSKPRNSLPRPTGDEEGCALSAPQTTRRAEPPGSILTEDKWVATEVVTSVGGTVSETSAGTTSETSAETVPGDEATPPTSAEEYSTAAATGTALAVKPRTLSEMDKLPDRMRSLSGHIRAAVEKARKRDTEMQRSGQVPAVVKDEESCVLELPPNDIFVELTDQLRECIELKLNRPDLITKNKNRDCLSLNQIMSTVKAFNADNPSAAIDIGPLLSRTPIVSRSEVMPEIYLEALTPAQQLRLRSSERQYQRIVSRTPLFNKLRTLRAEATSGPEGLAIELRGSAGMATSLVIGLFLSFLVGFFGPKYFGIDDVPKRAICGLVACVFGMGVEIGLILVRFAKLDRIKHSRQQRADRKLAHARRERDGRERQASGSPHMPPHMPRIVEVSEHVSKDVTPTRQDQLLRQRWPPACAQQINDDSSENNKHQ